MNSLKLGSNLTVENTAPKVSLDRYRITSGLNSMRMGDLTLAPALCDYIETGKNEAILLQARGKATTTYCNLHNGKILYALNYKWQPLAFIRLGKVLASLSPITSTNYKMRGTSISPDWWRYSVYYLQNLDHSSIAAASDELYALIQKPGKLLLELADIGGLGVEDIFDVFIHNYNGYRNEVILKDFYGIEDWFIENRQTIISLAKKLPSNNMIEFCDSLYKLNLVEPFTDFLIEETMSKSKTVRQKALLSLNHADKIILKERILQLFPTQPSANQILLVNAVIVLFNEQAKSILEIWKNDKNPPKLKKTIEEQLNFQNATAHSAQQDFSNSGGSYLALDGSIVTIPAYDKAKEQVHFAINPIDESYFLPVFDALANYNHHFDESLARRNPNDKWHWTKNAKKLDKQQVNKELHAILSGSLDKALSSHNLFDTHQKRNFDTSGLKEFAQCKDLSLYQLMLLLNMEHYVDHLSNLSTFGENIFGPVILKKMREIGDWRVLNHICIKQQRRPILEHLLTAMECYDLPLIPFIKAEDLWTLVAENLDLLDQAFNIAPPIDNVSYRFDIAFYLLTLLPKVPMRYATALILMVTGNNLNGNRITQQERQQARTLLAASPQLDPAISGLLENEQKEIRIKAADWLKSRKAVSQIPALQAALKKEKNDAVRGALLSALQHLGDDISSHFVAEKLLSEAQKRLEKAKGKELDWFPFSQLPQVTWNNGNAVDPVIIRWLLILATKLKQPQGNPMITLWLDQFTKESAHTLGAFIVEAWIAYDTPMTTNEEATSFAIAHIDQRLQTNLQLVKAAPQSASFYTTDRDLLFEELRHEKLGKYKQSAIDSKGILALATRTDGATIAAIGSSYIKKHGKRTAQAKAIIDMLAENPATAAIQAILAAATRTKQKTVQDHARQAINDIAEQYGWTLDELADRTIPTAGLDDNGEAELACGKGRIFKLKLNEQGNLIIFNDKGSQIKSLPTASNAFESQEIDEAKKFIANAQKEIKQVGTVQTERLFEAMCLERVWSVEEWQNYLFNHPVMRKIICGLIWIGMDNDGKPLLTFRPMEDGSFTDSSDEAVDLNKVSTIKLAHISLLNNEEGNAWRNHIKDYALTPPFRQLREDLPIISNSIKQQFEITDRNGFMVESNSLRNLANKLGYQRGDIVDGGYFTNYIRRHTSLNLVASINFTGNILPEKIILTALTSLCFYKMSNNKYSANMEIALEEVPPVLLAETYADYHAMAAAGTGFDKDWEAKSELY
ncbi:DUF4132 domain-containing protein [Bartonella sp. HY761]|uniref:DUF4132 domain-containing protein n=1 Tax=Bartonella sp. HY761 TaxID=2979330 RepID=UPI00220919DC|nr:DUF4132 domain-containing protein [Bartonella sp. HY761]UXN06200.1 DUF4132 domain-containing protein [Bartonella sp. HY761]